MNCGSSNYGCSNDNACYGASAAYSDYQYYYHDGNMNFYFNKDWHDYHHGLEYQHWYEYFDRYEYQYRY
jgi:hypothetical protein